MGSQRTIVCPKCGHPVLVHQNPLPTVDAIVAYGGGVVLVRRKNPPYGWALPGGFVDYGESVEQAIAREVREETGLALRHARLFSVYSDPGRDPRHHTITTVFSGRGEGDLAAGDDASDVGVFPLDNLPELAFDHARILDDYRASLHGRTRGG
ncbi:MAG TPA: NUDIX hydrolase [Deltaproteobacteria bacterium]|nr:NUDIX hydrolase [Deltaproteobacteria bacterium]